MTPFQQAVTFLPQRLRQAVLREAQDGEEIRLRAGRGLTISGETGGEHPVLSGGRPIPVTTEDLRLTLELATCASYHTAEERLNQGFLPLKGGHRLGITGTVALREGRISGIQSLSSLCLRVAHPVRGIADQVGGAVFAGGPVSTLILSPPGRGKTTLLRELIRVGAEEYGQRVGLADERGEVAALWKGIPQLDVGERTDVLDGCSKAEGLMRLLRTMSPQVLAADEITAPEDLSALSMAANCGVPVLATAHGDSVQQLLRRPLYQRIWEERLFRQVVFIRIEEGERRYQVEELKKC